MTAGESIDQMLDEAYRRAARRVKRQAARAAERAPTACDPPPPCEPHRLARAIGLALLFAAFIGGVLVGRWLW